MIANEQWVFDPVTFVRQGLGFHPDPAQQRVLTANAKRVILCCSRQPVLAPWGKSTVTALLALHRALSRDDSLILALAPCERQSGLLVAKVARFTRDLGLATKRDGMNKCSAVLPNGSAVIGLPGKEQYLRGYSAVSLLIVDEAARVDDELCSAMRPMLAVSDRDVWMMSTPFGRRGFFYKVWSTGEGENCLRLRAPATECPRARRPRQTQIPAGISMRIHPARRLAVQRGPHPVPHQTLRPDARLHQMVGRRVGRASASARLQPGCCACVSAHSPRDCR